MLKVDDFTTPLSPVDGSFKQKPTGEMLELNGIINQIDKTGVCITIYPSSK